MVSPYSRRAFLTGGSAAAAWLAVTRRVVAAHTSGTPLSEQIFAAPLVPFRTSLSVSPFTEMVLRSVGLTDGTYTAESVREVQGLFMRYGATEVYARIATRKTASQGAEAEHGWERGLERARLARELGLPFNPELGLWAEYGDAGTYQQPPDFSSYPSIQLPASWTSLTLEQMLPPLRKYGAEVARQILGTGAEVIMWDIGNEVEFGIAGVTVRPFTAGAAYQAPDAVDPAIGNMSAAQLISMPERDRIAWSSSHLWPYVGRLIAATAEGIRSVAPSARLSTHISQLGQKTSAFHLAFWRILKEAGFLPDQFGFSYYPGLGKSQGGPPDTFEWFKATATALKTTFGRKVFIAEGGYASSKMPPESYPFNDQVENYPLSNAGQHNFTKDLIAWGNQSGCLAGFRPWAPDLCLPGWAPMSWFTQLGKIATAKPVVRAFEEALPTLFIGVDAVRSLRGQIVVSARVSSGILRGLIIEIRDEDRVLATTSVAVIDTSQRNISLRPDRTRLPRSSLSLVVRSDGATLLDRRINLA
jgi:hypothetical protein